MSIYFSSQGVGHDVVLLHGWGLGKLANLFCAVLGYGILVDDLLPSLGARYRVLNATRTGARTGQAGPPGSGVRYGFGAKADLTRKDGKRCD